MGCISYTHHTHTHTHLTSSTEPHLWILRLAGDVLPFNAPSPPSAPLCASVCVLGVGWEGYAVNTPDFCSSSRSRSSA